MLMQSLFGRACRHYFDLSGHASRLQYFGFLSYVTGATAALLTVEHSVPAFQGQMPTLSGLFLGFHMIPLTGVFLRRLRDAGQTLPLRLLPLWAALLLAFPLALHFDVGTLFAIVAVTLGQLLCFDALRQQTRVEEPQDEPDAWTPSVWHQLPPSAPRGTSEIYRVRSV